MRVVSGSARGVPLVALDGLTTRPTTDCVKESIFNILQFQLAGKRVLDLFAGSGALGIEALSRGAEHCTFVDQNPLALQVVQKNLDRTHLKERATLYKGSFDAFLEGAPSPFELVFLDPPYASDFAPLAAKLLMKNRLLAPNGLLMLEHDRLQPELEAISGLHFQKTYHYGKVFVTFYRNEEML